MSAQETKTTDDHETIKKWAEERYGEPALVEGIVDKGKAAEMLRIYFPGQAGESLKNIPWELFYTIFDENNLAFIYQEETIGGDKSKFCKFIYKK